MTVSALSRNRDLIVAAALVVASVLLALTDRGDLLSRFTVESLSQVIMDELRRFLNFFLL